MPKNFGSRCIVCPDAFNSWDVKREDKVRGEGVTKSRLRCLKCGAVWKRREYQAEEVED